MCRLLYLLLLSEHKNLLCSDNFFRGGNLSDHLCYVHAFFQLKTKNCLLFPPVNNKRPGSDLLYMCHEVSFLVNWHDINKKLKGVDE